MYKPTTRARMSVVPPAENGTMMVMGLVGNAGWAWVTSGARDTATAAVAKTKARRFSAAGEEKRDMAKPLRS